jgi:exosortase A-associated hydrolase 1
VVLWGLCDGASAAALYAPLDTRVRGLVLLNPWVRTEDGIARTTLKHYYRNRMLDTSLWRKIAAGRFDAGRALRARFGLLRRAFGSAGPEAGQASLPQRMHQSLSRFTGPVLLVLSGADLTAREFSDLAAGAPEWRSLLAEPRCTRHELAAADHTFSRREWRDQVAALSAHWVRSW